MVATTTLGNPRWRDPERRHSIDHQHSVRLAERHFNHLYLAMTCWLVRPPARVALTEAYHRIEALIRDRNDDLWKGEATTPGCFWERYMFGRDVDDAQPTILFCSSSSIVRGNARNIIMGEDIQVDP